MGRKLTESQIRNAPTVNCYVCDNVVFEDQAEYAPQDVEQVKPYCPKCIEEHPFLVDPMNGETEDSPTRIPEDFSQTDDKTLQLIADLDGDTRRREEARGEVYDRMERNQPQPPATTPQPSVMAETSTESNTRVSGVVQPTDSNWKLVHADGTVDPEIVSMTQAVAMASNRANAEANNPWRWEPFEPACDHCDDTQVIDGEACGWCTDVAYTAPPPTTEDVCISLADAGLPGVCELCTHCTTTTPHCRHCGEPIQTVSLAAVCPKRFAVVNLATDDQPQGFDSIQDARAHADKLTNYEIWDGDTLAEVSK